MSKNLKKKKTKVMHPHCEVKKVVVFLKARNFHLDSIEKAIWNQKI